MIWTPWMLQQILSLTNCPGKRHYYKRLISNSSLMTNKTNDEKSLNVVLVVDIPWKVSTYIFKPPQHWAVDSSGGGCILKHLFTRGHSHFFLQSRLYNKKRRFPLFASVIASGVQGAAARARHLSCAGARLLLLRWETTVVRLFNSKIANTVRTPDLGGPFCW